MPIFIKTGFWEKAKKSYKGWLNLDDLIQNTFSSIAAISLRVQSIVNTSTLTFNLDDYDAVDIIEQSESLNITNPIGTPSNMNRKFIRITDNGVARLITFGNKFRAIGATLPTITTPNKTMYIEFYYNVAHDTYDVTPYQEEI